MLRGESGAARRSLSFLRLMLSAPLRYMEELMRLKAAARAEGSDFLTWNDIQACIDQVNLAVQEEHERKRLYSPRLLLLKHHM